MKKLMLGLLVFLTAILTFLYWPRSGSPLVADVATEPASANTHATEKVQVAVPSVDDAKPARPIVAFGGTTTLPRELWPHVTNILTFYGVFDVWVGRSMKGISGIDSSDAPHGETFEEFQARARKEGEESEAAEAEMVRAEATQKIYGARQKLEQELGPELTLVYNAWSETNGMTVEALVQLRTATQNAWFAATNGIAGKNSVRLMDSL